LNETNIFTVSQLTSLLKEVVEQTFSKIELEGEISNFKVASSGHWYFQLNDNDATISAVMFKNASFRLPFVPKDGDRVIVTGSLSIYAKRGNYQIVCTTMRQSGLGDILLMLQKRKEEFALKGYFDAELKKPIPLYPKKVGIVSSSTGAALQDMLKVFKRSSCSIEIVVLPTLVQGLEAAPMIAKQIELANKLNLVEVLIVGRGGGSIEDLLPFSESVVVEAIFNSKLPVISAVGHETDFSLSDYVADVRSSTPTAAAEFVVQNYLQLQRKIDNFTTLYKTLVLGKIERLKSEARLYSQTNLNDYFGRKIEQISLLTDDLNNQMLHLIQNKYNEIAHRSALLKERLINLSPVTILERGYSIVTNGEGKVISVAKELKEDEIIRVRFAQGQIEAITKTIED
jgi:exodeoxyribonuclease VII large subunit